MDSTTLAAIDRGVKDANEGRTVSIDEVRKMIPILQTATVSTYVVGFLPLLAENSRWHAFRLMFTGLQKRFATAPTLTNSTEPRRSRSGLASLSCMSCRLGPLPEGNVLTNRDRQGADLSQ